ncbi:hypothetical protein C2857_001565 [Epichloe festucae Fl1]|uniref:Nudix hydrolase domain-containing protein n=1 Tax=Epichloe festucae (strain Fl1) TaxID=877507 RepID=A0A7U3SNB4_EPIFF|nr:hypothetical protein C2857_001565 [Epichloe festucae Fl1]
MTTNQMQLKDWLDDLCVRFIINLPEEDLSSVARICFQVEEAQWFYEDFIRPLNPNLPSMSLRTFCLRIFQHCPLLASFSVENHAKAFEEFMQYKTRVPVRGAIMLNQAMDSVVLVKGWKKGANWSFPRGKINKDEDDLDCAVREVYEETGLDLRAAGLVPTEKKPKYIEISMREQQLRLYVFRDIPMDTKFQPRTRKEISKIEWYKLSELPAFRKKGAQSQNESSGPAMNKFYMVAPFLFPLKKWISSQKKVEERRATSEPHHPLPHHVVDEVVTTEDDTWVPTNSERQTYVPAIETLDGATRELQRLLKMQPPTQGLQHSQPQEDKGSALLSILQSNNARPAARSQQSAMPHTPSHAMPSDVPQPRNPHHQTNLHHGGLQAQHPPPSFPIPPSHETPMWDPAVNQPQISSSYHPEFRRQIKVPYGQHASLQTQSLASPYALDQQQLPSQHDSYTMNSSMHTLPSQSTVSEQSNQLPAAPGSAKLSGASLALLNAFKRDAVSPAAQSPPQFSQIDPNAQLEASGRAAQTNVSELVGSAVRPAGDQHRSNLLGMFKNSPANNAPSLQPLTTMGQQNSLPRKVENALLQQLQGNRGPDSQQFSLDRLSLKANLNSPVLSLPPDRETQNLYRRQSSYPQAHWQHQQQRHARSPFAPSPSQQPQPIRILQRGQTINNLDDLPNQHTASPRASPFPSKPPPVQTGLAFGESHASQPANGGYNPDGSRDQKKQLLSLFGKQQAPGTEQAGSGELPRSRVSSMASKGGETPISPAEQTFLLDYLQSVTHNAGRR